MLSLPVSMKRFHQEQPRKSGNTVFQIITLSVAMETSGRIWPGEKAMYRYNPHGDYNSSSILIPLKLTIYSIFMMIRVT